MKKFIIKLTYSDDPVVCEEIDHEAVKMANPCRFCVGTGEAGRPVADKFIEWAIPLDDVAKIATAKTATVKTFRVLDPEGNVMAEGDTTLPEDELRIAVEATRKDLEENGRLWRRTPFEEDLFGSNSGINPRRLDYDLRYETVPARTFLKC